MKNITLLTLLLLSFSCQSSSSAQRSIAISGLVPFSGTSTASGDVEKTGMSLRLENREGHRGAGLELRQAAYAVASEPSISDSEGMELAAIFRRYTDVSNNALFLEVSPILGFGAENDGGVDSGTYALLRLAAGFRWMLDERIYFDVDGGYYFSLMAGDNNWVGGETSDANGADINLSLGFFF